MNIFDYVATLLPTISKDRLQENIDVIRKEINTIGIPSYEQAQVSLKALQSKEGKALEKDWQSQSKDLNKNLIKGVLEGLKRLQGTIDVCENAIDKEFELVTSTSGINALRANIIQIVSVLDYVSIYSIKLLNYLYVCETNHINADNKAETSLSASEVDELRKHMGSFAYGMAAVAKDEAKAKRVLGEIPDVLISSASRILAESTLSRVKIDPLNLFGMVGFKGNPIYSIRMVVAEWQVRRYNRSRDLKAVLELRKLNLEQQRVQNPSPQIEREIAVLQSRIDSEGAKIKDMEDSIK